MGEDCYPGTREITIPDPRRKKSEPGERGSRAKQRVKTEQLIKEPGEGNSSGTGLNIKNFVTGEKD